MEINIALIAAAIILLIGAVFGWRRGLIEGLIRIVSCVFGTLVLAVVLKGIGSFIQGGFVSAVIALLLLIFISMIHRFVRFLLNTFKLVRAIPFGRFADKLFGVLLGAVEAVFVLWLIFLLIGSIDALSPLNELVTDGVGRSSLLTLLYNSNYLVVLLKTIW